MPELSVIICTHNPRADYLDATLGGLAHQTLPRDKWELVFIDNASATPLSPTLAQTAHPSARVIREETLGLTPARLRGIRETSTPLIVFVDDDNILDPDYLERALAISAKWDSLGVWGGQSIARYEEAPAEWLKPWCWVAVRELQHDEWSNGPIDGRAVPFGAGMCVRRAVAERYALDLTQNPLRLQFDRTGTQLSGSGDTDLICSATAIDMGRGLFQELKLTHLIPASRVQPDYLLRLVGSTIFSYQVMLHLHGYHVPETKPWTWWQRWKRLRHVSPRERPFIAAVHEGHLRASQFIASLNANSSASAPTSFRSFEQTPLRWAGEKRRENYSQPEEREAQPRLGTHSNERRTAAAQLTQLMEATPGFTYLRLGDGELRMLLAHQSHAWSRHNFALPWQASVNVSVSNPGLREQDMPRLQAAYEACTWLDRYDNVSFNRDHLHELTLNRPANALSNPTAATAQIFIDWTWYEMRDYLAKHRCLFCGSEASLLQALHSLPEYRQLAKRFWPESTPVFFQQTRRDGKHISEDLDLIRSDIAADIDKHHIDTVFISLGGAAKIIAHDLAREKGVRVFDFGSMIRALTYSGSDGHAQWRSAHYPFLVRVPFDLYMRSLQNAHPNLDAVTLISKAHAQLARELVRQVPLEFSACDTDLPSAYAPTRENVRHFLASYSVYRRHYYPWAYRDPKARPLLREFRNWRLHRGLGLDGKLYQLARKCYHLLRPARN